MLEDTFYSHLLKEISDGLKALELAADDEKDALIMDLAENYVALTNIYNWELWKMIEYADHLEFEIHEFYHILRDSGNSISELFWKSIASHRRFQVVAANHLLRADLSSTH